MKAKRLAKLPLVALALLAVLAVRLMRPFVLVRFGVLRSARFGPFTQMTELYLCERDLLEYPRRTIDVFHIPQPAVNQQIERMCRRVLHVSRFVALLRKTNRLFPGHERHEVKLPREIDSEGYLRRSPAHLSFTEIEELEGANEIQGLGVPDGIGHVCFHARDQAYLEETYPGRQWGYHDYRNATVGNYLQAADSLTQRGHYVIRMGAVVGDPLDTSNSMIIDYASRHRTDFLDIYLPAKCRFFICDTSGIYAVAEVFRRPIAWVNYVPLDYVHSWMPDDLTIPKKLWLRREKRMLTFRETIESGAGSFINSDQFENLGVDVIENSPEEITALAIEMDERLDGTWQPADGDEELQRRFWSMYEGSDLHGKLLSRIGAEFLRQNRELLE